MKERPIPFSAPMVRAILSGTKTQTRRVVKMPGLGWIGCCCGGSAARWIADGDRWHCGTCGGGARLTPSDVEYLRCPYGQPGDRLWVREAWRTDRVLDALKPSLLGTGAPVFYEAEAPHQPSAGRYRPPMFMPRWASRITLEVTGVRVERLHDISEEDAIAEGIERDCGFWRHYGCVTQGWIHAVNSYETLWEQINGPGSWDANPWVWVVEFRRIDGSPA